jgi:hypothetical protein
VSDVVSRAAAPTHCHRLPPLAAKEVICNGGTFVVVGDSGVYVEEVDSKTAESKWAKVNGLPRRTGAAGAAWLRMP